MSEAIKLEIKQESIQAIISAHVQTAVMEALLPHKEQFVEELVRTSLLSKPDNEYNRYKQEHQKITLLEEMVRKIIAEEAKKAVIAWAESHREEIAKNIQKQLKSSRFAQQAAMSMVETMLQADEYRMKVEVTPWRREGR